MEKKRIFWADFVRAVACVCVVIVHFNANVSAWWTLNAGIGINYFLDIYLGAIGVNLFFIISGAMLMHVYMTKGEEPLLIFYKKRFLTLYPMYWIAFLGATSVSFLVMGRMPSDNIVWIFNALSGFNGYLTMLGITPIAFYQIGEWFFAVIVCLYIIVPFLLRAAKKHTFFLMGGVVCGYILMIVCNIHDKFVLMYVPHMVFGMVMMKYVNEFDLKMAVSALGLLLALYFYQSYYNLRNDIYSFLACTALYIILGYIGQMVEKSHMKDIVCWIAKYSYPIFLVHHRLITLLCLRFDLSTLSKRDVYLLFTIFIGIAALISRYLFIANMKIMAWIMRK